MIRRLSALWRGRLPLTDAFWNYLVFWGVVINASVGALGYGLLIFSKRAAAVSLSPDLVAASGLVLHLLPIPYNAIAAVGVWRSAGAEAVGPITAMAARTAAVLFFIIGAIV